MFSADEYLMSLSFDDIVWFASDFVFLFSDASISASAQTWSTSILLFAWVSVCECLRSFTSFFLVIAGGLTSIGFFVLMSGDAGASLGGCGAGLFVDSWVGIWLGVGVGITGMVSIGGGGCWMVVSAISLGVGVWFVMGGGGAGPFSLSGEDGVLTIEGGRGAGPFSFFGAYQRIKIK